VFLKENKDIREKLETALRKKLEIAQPGNSSAGSSGANGHAAALPQGDRAPQKAAAAAAASSDAAKSRPGR